MREIDSFLVCSAPVIVVFAPIGFHVARRVAVGVLSLTNPKSAFSACPKDSLIIGAFRSFLAVLEASMFASRLCWVELHFHDLLDQALE